MWVRLLGWEDPLEEGMATHSSILAWRIPMDRGAWRATVHKVTKSRPQPKRPSTHACMASLGRKEVQRTFLLRKLSPDILVNRFNI